MEDIIIYVFKTAICLNLFLIVFQLFLRRSTFFKFNRGFMILGIIGAFLIPLLRYTYKVAISENNFSLSTTNNNVINLINSSYPNIFQILFFIYFIGLFWMVISKIKTYIKIKELIREGESTILNNYKIIKSEKINSAFTILSYIFINSDLKNNIEKELIVKHEMAHVNQKHWIDLLLCESLLIIQWFNPFTKTYINIIKENHEYSADKEVLDSGVSISMYQATLINQRLGNTVFTFSNSFNNQKPINRLFMLTEKRTSSWKRIFSLIIIPLLGIFVWLSATPTYDTDKDSTVTIQKTNKQDSLKTTIIDNKILVIIDGKEENMETLNTIDPSDIESVSILKDENATNKYGEKGRNGVIIVNRKK